MGQIPAWEYVARLRSRILPGSACVQEMSVATSSVAVMESGFDQLSDGQLLAVIGAALDALNDDRLRLPTDAEQMDLLLASLRIDGRLQAWQQQLGARIETDDVAWRERKTSTTTWLAEAANLTPREARRLVKAGQELRRFATVREAAAEGRLLPAQAEAITSVLANLPAEFPTDTIARGEESMVGFAATHNSAELRRLTGHLLEVLAPETADALEADRLEREHRAAMGNRHLEFHPDGHGSTLIRGSLPIAQAAPFIAIIDAYSAAAKRGLESLDPHAEYLSPSMRRADALLAMVNQHSQQALAPVNGGDRPRIVLTMSYDKLAQQAADAGLATANCTLGNGATLVGCGEPLSASVVRQWLCDTDLMPAVLGGPSEILDVGRTERLVTPAIRAALELRDGGCVFPGCNAPPSACQAHHIVPWWAGGDTALPNLVLLCPHHHGIVEPGRDPTADRWQVRLRNDGVPEILPPRRVDPQQKPRLHARFHTRR